jgi:hypothetical protein
MEHDSGAKQKIGILSSVLLKKNTEDKIVLSYNNENVLN